MDFVKLPLPRPAATRKLRLALAFSAAAFTAAYPGGNGLNVHEWGTFTTLAASDGRQLGGLYVDATRLPAFVHGLPYFNYDLAKGWASLDKLRNVAVKMETPVIYFYSHDTVDVDVKVKFTGGTISQWYPTAYAGETNPVSPFVDFATAPYAGHVSWKAKVLGHGGKEPAYTTTASGLETAEWTAPRAVGANMLQGSKGEHERFLFYRGLGCWPNTVKLAFKNDSVMSVTNDGDENIPWLMVYDRDRVQMSNASVWWQGPLKARQVITILRSSASQDYAKGMAAMDTLKAHMIKAGLRTDEATAMLNTWYNGYFLEGGIKAFWILPRAMVDRILPLTIQPQPDSIERVIVGRSEILPPEFERELRKALAADSLSRYAKDKYYLAYLDFLHPDKDWNPTGLPAAYPARRSGAYAPGMHTPAFGFGGILRDILGRPALPSR
jgi:hypothetical protein